LLQHSNGNKCATWSNYTLPTGAANTSTPWISYALNAIYLNDGAGQLYKINATTGALIWSYTFSASGSSASPAEFDGILYIGDGAGNLWRIVDPGATAPTVSASVSLSAANCTSPAAVDGSVAIDGTASIVFLPNQGCMFTFPHYATTGTWAIKASGWTGSVPNQTFQTWPTLDGTYIYWVIADFPTSYTANSTVWKAPYSMASVNSSLLKHPDTVSATPLIWNGSLYAGDQRATSSGSDARRRRARRRAP
jgi:outer membrane protein assembly factor BamB